MSAPRVPVPRVVPLRPRQKALWPLSPTQRLNELLKRKDFKHLVRTMPVQDLYTFIRELGLEDAGPLLENASGDQIQRLTDLEVWNRFELDRESAVRWLEVVFAASPTAIAPRIRDLDISMLMSLLLPHVKVWINEEDMPPQLEQELAAKDLAHTPDDLYLIEFDGEPTTIDFIRRMLDELFREDLALARQLMDELRTESLSNSEEDAYRLASGRLEELGFVPWEEAMALYSPLPPGSRLLARVRQHDPPSLLQQVIKVEAPAQGTFLREALARFQVEHPTDNLTRELAQLGNRVVVAERLRPSDPEAPRRAAEIVYGELGLGLELASGGDLSRAVELLASTHCMSLFRQGHTALAELRRKVRRELDQLRQRYPLTPPLELGFEETVARVWQSFDHIRPAYLPPEGRGESRPFRSVHELEETRRLLLGGLAPLHYLLEFMALGVVDAAELQAGIPPEETVLRPANLLFTALAHQVLYGKLIPRPLSSVDLRRFLLVARGEEGGLRPDLIAELLKTAIQFGERTDDLSQTAVEGWLKEVCGEFREHYGRLDPQRPLDSRLLGGPVLLTR